jgi:hypothetical protein
MKKVFLESFYHCEICFPKMIIPLIHESGSFVTLPLMDSCRFFSLVPNISSMANITCLRTPTVI